MRHKIYLTYVIRPCRLYKRRSLTAEYSLVLKICVQLILTYAVIMRKIEELILVRAGGELVRVKIVSYILKRRAASRAVLVE